MLAVPSVVGLAPSHGAQFPGRLVLIAALVVGYFCFNAVTLLIKSARRRRQALVAPTLVYGVATAALLAVAAVLLGPRVLTWALAYAPLALAALILVWMRQERSVVSGGLTVAAATLFATTLAHPDFLAYVEHWSAPGNVVSRWTTIIAFLYFFGTVWAVKTMIRQRGSLWWWGGSIAYHLVALLVVGVAVGLGRLGLAYVAFFALTTLRATALPKLGPLASVPRTFSPMTLGLVELAFSLALTGLLIGLPPTP